MVRALAVVFQILSCLLPLAAQKPSVGIVDSYIRREMRRQQIPGIALAVLKHGQPELLRTYGFANLEHNIPVKQATVFQSGSMGKQFTAAAVMLLVHDGKLRLDDPVNRYLPDAPASWSNITIRRLLNHTAGLGNFGDEVNLRRDYTEKEFWELIKASALKFEPGSDWSYSNLGYVTLGILIHKVTGEFYGDLLVRRVFKPLGMEGSRVISESDIISDRAAGYRIVNGALKNQEWVSPSNNTTADGSLYVTLADLIKWDRALISKSVFNKAALEEIWSPAILSDGRRWPYGFGWHLGQIDGKKVVFHGGAWQGFKSFIGRVLEDDRTIIFLANSWETHDFQLAHGLLALYYPKLRHPTPPISDGEEEGDTSFMRRLLMQIVDGEISQNQLSRSAESNLATVEIPRIREQLRGLSIPIAVVSTSELISVNVTDRGRILRYLLSDVLKSLVVTLEFDAAGKVLDVRAEEL